MDCPKCGTELKLGSVRSPNGLLLLPEGHKEIMNHRKSFHPEAIELGTQSFFGRSAPAYYCNKCKLILMEYA